MNGIRWKEHREKLSVEGASVWRDDDAKPIYYSTKENPRFFFPGVIFETNQRIPTGDFFFYSKEHAYIIVLLFCTPNISVPGTLNDEIKTHARSARSCSKTVCSL